MSEVRHLSISGRVQGVCYRASMGEEAARLGITGWVRNRYDGSVEAVIAGSAEAVAAMIAWARRGPPAAEVTLVTVEQIDGEFSAFEQRDTA